MKPMKKLIGQCDVLRVVAMSFCATLYATELSALEKSSSSYLASNQSTASTALCEEADKTDSANAGMSRSFVGLRRGRDGWLFRDQDLLTSYGPAKKNFKYLRQLRQKLDEAGVTLVMVPIPSRALVESRYLGDISFDDEAATQSYRQFLQRLRRSGVVVPELETLLADAPDKPMFFARDHHWNHHGARSIARLTAASMRDHERYAQVKPNQFHTELVTTAHNHGSYARAGSLLCDKSFSSEPYKIYQTALVSDEVFGDDELFGGDENMASISLVGTSNSKGKLRLNFSGFLSHYVKSDVLNLAVSGGGYDKAMKDYVASRDFRENPPTFLVWEFPAYYRLNDETFFKELMSSIGGKS